MQHAGNADFVTGETGTWPGGPVTYGLTAEFYRAATPVRPYQVAMQRGIKGYADQTTRPLNDIRWELFALLSHGAFVTMVDKLAYDGGGTRWPTSESGRRSPRHGGKGNTSVTRPSMT